MSSDMKSPTYVRDRLAPLVRGVNNFKVTGACTCTTCYHSLYEGQDVFFDQAGNVFCHESCGDRFIKDCENLHAHFMKQEESGEFKK